MPILEPIDFIEPLEGLRLPLRRFPGNVGSPHVALLLHGASAGHETFLVGQGGSLAEYLSRAGVDVWLLDWRGSKNVVPEPRHLRRYNLDEVADWDIPMALHRIRKHVGGAAQIAVFGHCLGAAALAQTFAAYGEREPFPWERDDPGRFDRRQNLKAEVERVERSVLCAIGLFWRVPAIGLLKAYDRVLEQVDQDDGLDRLHPSQLANNDPESAELNDLFEVFPAWLRPHREPKSEVEHFCNALSFMYGQPYRHSDEMSEVHDHELMNQFGTMWMPLYVHGTENIRRGWSGPAKHPEHSWLLPAGFKDVRLTLITGNENQLWHRDSIDRMYEWLANHFGSQHAEKHVLKRFAHQDLLWSSLAPTQVFPLILRGLFAELG